MTNRYFSKQVILLIFVLFLFSCNKQNDQQSEKEIEEDVTEEDSDTTMTAEEIFSSSLVQDITGSDDVELQIYLEEQFYPTASKSKKVTLDRLTSSIYLLSYDDNGTMKNFLLQKFYNPVDDEFVFEKTETHTSAAKQFQR